MAIFFYFHGDFLSFFLGFYRLSDIKKFLCVCIVRGDGWQIKVTTWFGEDHAVLSYSDGYFCVDVAESPSLGWDKEGGDSRDEKGQIRDW